MTTFRLHISTNNDARSRSDVIWMLLRVAQRMDEGVFEGTVLDVNGNAVGDFRLKQRG